MPEKKKRISLIIQVAILFVAGLILIGTLSSLVSYFVSKLYVTDQLKASAKAIAMDLEGYMNQFPSHDLILRCWYDNYDKLDIEYDADYNTETLTAEKCGLLAQRHPEFQLEYATVKDVEALPLEDRMLYAEIIYSWLISRIDQMAEHYNLDYLYCVITEAPYDQQFVLFIASENSVKRGNEPGMLYPFGKIIKSTKEQQDAIKKAVSEEPQLAPDKSGDYLDYYYPIASVDGHDVLIGVTRNVQFLEKKTKSYSFNLSVISIIFLSIMAIDCLLMILFVVLRPLKKIQDSIRLYKDTKDGAAVAKNLSEVKSRNELSQLKDDVADLTKEMDDYIVRIEKGVSEKERIRTEMTLASRIQTAMLPNVFPPYPDRKDFEICASMTPAKQIGGDFYDFFLLKDRYLCLTIADVSGKGIPAALFMMASKITLSHHFEMGKSPAQILSDTNQAICSKNPERMFITIWLGILDLYTGKLTAGNAGHQYPIIMKAGGSFELLQDKHDFVVGGIKDTKYREYELQLDPGSKLFLYTDGLTEASNASKQMFGENRILEELNREPDASPEQILENMQNAVDAFVQDTEPFDDLTMMCITYQGPGN